LDKKYTYYNKKEGEKIETAGACALYDSSWVLFGILIYKIIISQPKKKNVTYIKEKKNGTITVLGEVRL
jgi:hypothetical protein